MVKLTQVLGFIFIHSQVLHSKWRVFHRKKSEKKTKKRVFLISRGDFSVVFTRSEAEQRFIQLTEVFETFPRFSLF